MDGAWALCCDTKEGQYTWPHFSSKSTQLTTRTDKTATQLVLCSSTPKRKFLLVQHSNPLRLWCSKSRFAVSCILDY